MNTNKLPTEVAAIGAVIDPDVTAASTVVSDYMSMADFESALATILAGTLGTNATLNAKLVQATDSSGTGSKDITGKVITALTQAGGDSDSQAQINCRSEELDIDNDFTHVAISLTVAVATSDVGAILQGFNGRYGPASDNDLASVVEIVS